MSEQNNMAVHFSSKRSDWATPPDFFEKWNSQYHFELDVCATEENTKCPKFFTPRDTCRACGGTGVLVGLELDHCHFCDGLNQRWSLRAASAWMNPPYGREISKWVKKAYEESLQGTTVVCLLPARTDTAWWHDYVTKASEIHFVRGRIKFVGAVNSAPFPNVVVVFKGQR